ncbi:MAG: hypothetical protein LC541_14930 [Candidatus Thiodiazotropha sp.]|nr:hypothetical protein [Candidatus Thiodiazotropha sp.]
MKKPTDKNDLEAIEKSVLAYTEKMDEYETILLKIEKEISEVRNVNRSALLEKANELQQARDRLKTLIEENSLLFDDQKTRNLCDVKFGYRKKPDELVIEDKDKTVSLIKSRFESWVPMLLSERVTIKKTVLKDWSDKLLKQIRIKRIKGEDVILIKDHRYDQYEHYIEVFKKDGPTNTKL